MLFLRLHHIVTDKDSVHTITDDIQNDHFSVISHGEESLMVISLLLQYAQWASWIRSHPPLLPPSTDDFWKQQLSSRPRLPFSHVTESVGGESGASTSIQVSHSEPASQSFAIAAVSLAVYMVTGIKDVVIGASHADRSFPNTQSLVGIFLDRLPVRIHITAETMLSRSSFLSHSQEQLQKCLMHIASFQSIQQCVSDGSSIPFDVIVSFHRGHDLMDEKPTADRKSEVPIHSRLLRDENAALFPVLVNVIEMDGNINYSILYKPNLVDEAHMSTMKQVLGAFTSGKESLIDIVERFQTKGNAGEGARLVHSY